MIALPTHIGEPGLAVAGLPLLATSHQSFTMFARRFWIAPGSLEMRRFRSQLSTSGEMHSSSFGLESRDQQTRCRHPCSVVRKYAEGPGRETRRADRREVLHYRPLPFRL